MKKPRFYILIFVLVLMGSILSACAAGAGTATSWPGVYADPETETVYLAHGPHIYALNMANGTEKWRFPAEKDNKISFFAKPALTEDDQLLAGGYDNLFYSLNPSSGQQNWAFEQAENLFVADPLVIGEDIFAPNSDHSLYTLTPAGNLDWTFLTEHSLWGQPVTDGETLYLSSMDHHLYALDLESGKQLWKTDDLGGAVAGRPTLSSSGLLYVGTFNSELVTVDAQNGDILWRIEADGWVWDGPALDEDMLYFGDLSGTLFAANAENGAVVWQTQQDETPISDSPVVVDDTVYFVTEGGTIYALDKDSGNPRWSKNLEAKLYTTPEVVNDTILIALVDADPILVALDTNGNQLWSFVPEN